MLDFRKDWTKIPRLVQVRKYFPVQLLLSKTAGITPSSVRIQANINPALSVHPLVNQLASLGTEDNITVINVLHKVNLLLRNLKFLSVP